METFTLALIIATAATHASWNVIAKVSKNTVALMWWATVFGTVGYGVWLMAGPGLFLNPASHLPFLISALCETGYFITLVKGYSRGDLSLVYPVSRGSAPIFAALLATIVLGQGLPWVGYVGILLMVLGVYVASLPMEGSRPAAGFTSILHNSAAGWALASGIFIAVYSVSDQVAVAATNPLVYNWWVFMGNTVLWAPAVWRGSKFKSNMAELHDNWRGVTATAVLSVGSYAAALAALTMTSASYVVAGRGLSVIIGACLGSFLLKERFGTARILGAVLMVVGLGLIAFT